VGCQRRNGNDLRRCIARRTRCLFLDAYETEKIALQVVKVMCEEMEKDDSMDGRRT